MNRARMLALTIYLAVIMAPFTKDEDEDWE